MTLFQKFSVNPEFSVEKFEDEVLLYSTHRAAGVYLNETGYLILEMCKKGITLGEIIDLLKETYPQDQEAICKDTMEAVRQLVEQGVLFEKDSTPEK